VSTVSDNPRLARQLFAMTWPMLFGVLSLMTFQLVDSAFIGQLGRSPLAALGFTLPMQQLIIGLQVGLGIATTAIISRTLGAGDRLRAERLGGLVVTVGGILVLALCISLWLLQRPIMAVLGADATLLPLVSRYWLPWLIAAWSGAMLYFGYSISRSHGDTRLPGYMMVITSVLNIGLDYLYIFVFGWGLPGAGWATVSAFACGALVVYPQLWRRRWLRFDLARLRLWPALKQLSGIMAPAMVSQLMPPVSAMAATALVAGFGSAAVAAWGLGTRLEYFSIVVVLALTMSMPPMIGRMLGAGAVDQIRRLVRLGIRFVVLWQLLVGLLWLLASGFAAELFSTDTSVRALLQEYLLRVPLSYSGLGVCMLMVSVCNALGMGLRGLLISILRLFLCFLPALWIGSRLGDMPGLMSGALAGNLLAGVLAYRLYRQGMLRLQERSAGSGKA